MRYKKNLEKYCNRVFVLPFNTVFAKIKGIASLLKGNSISAGYFYFKKAQQIFNQWIAETQYHAIICFSSPMAEYIFRSKIFQFPGLPASQPPNLPASQPMLVMDFCDVDSDKWRQYSQQVRFPLNLIYRMEHRRLLQYEKKINQTFDRSIFVSQQEADMFSELYPDAKNVEVIANGVDYEYFSPEPFGREPSAVSLQSPILLFTGAMDYHANIDGVKWFCEDIWPLIKDSHPGIQLYIVGSNPHRNVLEMRKKDGVRVTGFVEDTRPYYNMADVCVIPLRLARGIQNKVLEAMSMEKPVVTTTTAIQGIQTEPGEHLLVADTPEDFTKAIKLLLNNPGLKERLGNKARQFVKKMHNWPDNIIKLGSLIGVPKIDSF